MKFIRRFPLTIATLLVTALAACSGADHFETIQADEISASTDEDIRPSAAAEPENSPEKISDYAKDEVIEPAAPSAPTPSAPETPASPTTPPATAPSAAAGAGAEFALSLEGTELDRSTFGVVKVIWSIQGTPAKALLYGTSLNRTQSNDGCGKTADRRFLAVNPPAAGAGNLLEGSPNYSKYEAYTIGEECSEAKGNCPGHKDDAAAPTVCAIDLTDSGNGGTFYTRTYLGNAKIVLAAQDADGNWQTTEKEIVLPTPSLSSSVTVSSTEPVAIVSVSASGSFGTPNVAGCLNPTNSSSIQKADGSASYHVQCALQKNTTITVTPAGAVGTSPATDTFQINVADPRVTLSHAGGTCNRTSSTVDWNDPATCEYTGTVRLATQVAFDYEVIKNGVSVAKESAAWSATPTFFAATYTDPSILTVDNWQEIPSKTVGHFAEVARDHEHAKFQAKVEGLDGAVVWSDELSLPYKSDFVFDASNKNAPTASVEQVNGLVVHVRGEMPWHGRHFSRMNYQCESKMNLNGVVDETSENISTDPGIWRSSDYDAQSGTFSVEAIFPMPAWNPLNPCTALLWKEEITCTFTAKGHDGKTYTSGPVVWTLTAEQSKLYDGQPVLNQTYLLQKQAGLSTEQICKQPGY